ncbi:MAG: hypothetical protein AAFZ99_08175 [Pseudomonadota bacterium]
MRFQLVDLALEGAFCGRACCVDQTICRFADLRLDANEFGLLRFALGLPLGDASIPNVFEHLGGDCNQAATWRQRLKQVFERAFDVRAFDGFAAQLATLLETFIVGIALVAPLCPIARHGMSAAVAGDVAAQREIVGADGLLRRCGAAIDAGLDAFKGVPRD